jgi:chromosomal replication initiation ATPase DnaA
MITPKILEAVEIGILDDEQLKIAITHYKELEKNLECHGEIYALVWRDVHRKLRELEGYKKSRQDNKKK